MSEEVKFKIGDKTFVRISYNELYILGEEVLLDGSNLEMGEHYIEHTQTNPDKYSLCKKDFDTETIENSWKIFYIDQ